MWLTMLKITFNSVLIVILFCVFMFLSYKIWLSENGFNRLLYLEGLVREEETINKNLVAGNLAMSFEVESLKNDESLIEYSARSDLGMIKKNETYYQFS